MAWNLDFWFRWGGSQGLGHGGDLNSFMASIAKRGYAKKSRYRVSITPPVALQKLAPQAGRLFEGRCEAVTFPGQNIRSVPDTLRYGPEREHAQGFTYGPISATFICDEALRERIFFQWWQQVTVNKDTWEPRYYDSAVGHMKIFQLGLQNQDTYGVELFEVFPKMIGPIDAGHAQSNAYQTVTVEFQFHHWNNVAPERTATLVEKPTKGDPDREKVAPLEQTKHGFMARNYKSSSIIRNPHADR